MLSLSADMLRSTSFVLLDPAKTFLLPTEIDRLRYRGGDKQRHRNGKRTGHRPRKKNLPARRRDCCGCCFERRHTAHPTVKAPMRPSQYPLK